MHKTKSKPYHPGNVYKVEFLEPFGLSVDEAAQKLGVSSKQLSAFINEQVPCTPELANQLSATLGNTVQFWLNLQEMTDVWHEEFERKVKAAMEENPDLPEEFIRDALLAKDEMDTGQLKEYHLNLS